MQSSSSATDDHVAGADFLSLLVSRSVYASALVDDHRATATASKFHVDTAPSLKPLKSILNKPKDQRLAFRSLPDLLATDGRRVETAND
ncbi:hypothetical protein Nepgr_022899 [Nepenthes gracilis]|uniref:Uncharacterized protein n=1 Tax=Nepenthes gracilis TaxID=150966 RepID=A0AAD3XX83_NEPGR|nr:hypothetical protein Nepgr_022899 [Nepenthes gracilis]